MNLPLIYHNRRLDHTQALLKENSQPMRATILVNEQISILQ